LEESMGKVHSDILNRAADYIETHRNCSVTKAVTEASTGWRVMFRAGAMNLLRQRADCDNLNHWGRCCSSREVVATMWEASFA
jgi:hypothetical protein